MIGRAPNLQYSPELKRAAVIALCERNTSAQKIAEKLAVCRPTLYNWKNQLLSPQAPATMNLPEQAVPPPEPQELAVLHQQIESLQGNIRRLQLEHDLLKKANELLKKDLGVHLHLLTNRDKTRLVDALKHTYSLAELFTKLALARSSYFYHCARMRMPDRYAQARIDLVDVFRSNHCCYGYRRMRAALIRRQHPLSEAVVRRLMKQECLRVPVNKRARYRSYLGEISTAPENLLNQNFRATGPNEKWLTDVTCRSSDLI